MAYKIVCMRAVNLVFMYLKVKHWKMKILKKKKRVKKERKRMMKILSLIRGLSSVLHLP